MDERKFSLLCFLIVLTEILCAVEGLKCRVDNDSKSVEDFEEMVRVCLRSPISSQDKSKNKNMWNRNRGNNKKSNKGKFGKDSDEYDDYDDDYGEDSNTDKKTQNKTMNNKGTNNKSNEGGIKLSTRFKRSPQYRRRGNGYNDYNNGDYRNNGDEERYMANSMMQGRGGFGYNDNGRGSYNGGRMSDNYNREDGNNGYYPMGGYGNYKPGRYKRSAQYPQNNNWDEGQDYSNKQRNRQNDYGNNGNSRDRYNNGRPSGFGNNGGSYGNNGGSFGNNGGTYNNNDRGYNNGGYGNSYSGSNNGGYGFHNNRWPGDNSQQGIWNNNRNSSQDSKNLSSPLKNVQPCVIHCILRQKKMLDDDSTPDKNAVIAAMTKNIKERDLKEFIQDSVTECFDNIDSDDIDGKCDMSKSLLMCLEEKGKQNCEDWNTAGPSTNPDKWFINNYNRPPNSQGSSSWR